MNQLAKSLKLVQDEYRKQVFHWKNKLDVVRTLPADNLSDHAAKKYVQEVAAIAPEVVNSYVDSIQKVSSGLITVDPSSRGLEKFSDAGRAKRQKKELPLPEPGKEFYEWIQNTLTLVDVFRHQRAEVSASRLAQIHTSLETLVQAVGDAIREI